MVRGTYTVTVGDRGRFVLPSGLRENTGLHEGDVLVLVETDDGVVMLTRAQARRRVRADLSGLDLVSELLAERRAASTAEDRAGP